MATWYPTANRPNLSPSLEPPLSYPRLANLQGRRQGRRRRRGRLKAGRRPSFRPGIRRRPPGLLLCGEAAWRHPRKGWAQFPRPLHTARVPKGKAPAGRRRRMRTLASRPKRFRHVPKKVPDFFDQKLLKQRSGKEAAAVWRPCRTGERPQDGSGPARKGAREQRPRPGRLGPERKQFHALGRTGPGRPGFLNQPAPENGGGKLRLD
jgi:hypothetical protein